VLDGATGVSTSVTLTNGDSIALVASRLNAAFALSNMHLTASVDASRLVLQSTDYGTIGGFTVSYQAGSADGTAALGIAAQAYTGLDVAGTLNGVAATGRGPLLTGASGDGTDGLTVRYTGTATGAMGTVRVGLGVGGLAQQVAEAVIATGTGSVDLQLSALSAQADRLSVRASRAEQLLADRRAALTRQFVAMEAAMAKAQSLGVALTSQLNAMRE
jgi:flagellar hook-associated protein 2